MKTKYARPTAVVVPILQLGQHLLAGTNEKVKATISGYDADDVGGFTQQP